MDFEDLGNLDADIDYQDKFIELNTNIDVSTLQGMPETLRSMFTELTFLGALCLEPRLISKYEDFIFPRYDFTSNVTAFFFVCLAQLGKRTDWVINQSTINSYMADNLERAKLYQRYGGYKWLEYIMRMAKDANAVDNIEHHFEMLKKYSLAREFWKKDTKVLMENLVKARDFPDMKPREVLLKVNSIFGKIFTKLANGEEVKDLTGGCESYIDEKLETPEQGLDLPFPIMTQVFQGVRLGQFWAWGMLSNAGKSRFLIRIIANLAFVQGKKVLIISNEMTEEEMRACLITTTINNPDIQKLHGIEITKNQVDIQNGVYKVDGKYAFKENVVDAILIRQPNESLEDYKKKLTEMSSEYRNIKAITHWIDTKMGEKIKIVETGSDYSDSDLRQIIENTVLAEGIDYVFYDTFKSDKDAIGEWSAMKKTATLLSEIAKKRNIFIGANIQLTDDANMCKPLELSSSNIANSKQIKHVLDALCLFKEIPYAEFDKYVYWKGTTDKPKVVTPLAPEKRYYVCRIDKNRAGIKPDILFTLNLNTNIWEEVGRVGYKDVYDPNKKKKKKFVNAQETHKQIEKQEAQEAENNEGKNKSEENK